MSSTPESRRPQFRTTAWTEVLLAAREANEHDTKAAGALDRLCRDYWYPIYAFIRRQGHEPAAAEDLAQGFFLKLLDKRYLDDADRTRGKFRTFLLASVKHFLANEHDRASAQKRGGGKQIFSLDFAEAERKYASSTTDNWTAEALFDRQWALALLDRVLIGLGESYDAAGKGSLFVALRGRILDASAGDSLSSIAAELQTTTGALKVALHRLRKDYRQRLVEEVAATVGSGDDVDDERSQLMDALAGGKL